MFFALNQLYFETIITILKYVGAAQIKTGKLYRHYRHFYTACSLDIIGYEGIYKTLVEKSLKKKKYCREIPIN